MVEQQFRPEQELVRRWVINNKQEPIICRVRQQLAKLEEKLASHKKVI